MGMNEITKKELLKHFLLSRASGGDPSRVTLIMGAGCSVSAGIPLAADIAKELVTLVYGKLHPDGTAETPDEQLAVLRENEPSLPSNWSLVYQEVFHHFFKSPDQQRDALEKCLSGAAEKTNLAHLAIGLLISHGHVGNVLTTNFDEMVADSCRLAGCDFRHYDRSDASSARPDKPLVMHWHGRMSSSYRLRNSSDDLCEGDLSETAFLHALLRESRLIIMVGYAGEEGSVMSTLEAVLKSVPDAHVVFVSYSGDVDAICERVKSLSKQSRHFAVMPGQDADAFFAMLLQELSVPHSELIRQWGAAVQIGKSVGVSDRARAEWPNMIVERVSGSMSQALVEAKSLDHQGRLDRAAKVLEDVVDQDGAAYWELAQAATILHKAGHRYADLAYLERSESVFAKAAKALAAEDHVSPLQDIVMNHARASVARDVGVFTHSAVKLREALTFTEAACDLFPANAPPSDVAEFWQRRGAVACDIAHVTRTLPDAENAISVCEQAAALVSGRRDIQYARTMENLGYAHMLKAGVLQDADRNQEALQASGEALVSYGKALAVARAASDHSLIAHIQLNTGNAHTVAYRADHSDKDKLYQSQTCFEESFKLRPAERALYDHYLSGTMLAQSLILRAHADRDTKWLSRATLLLADLEATLGSDKVDLLAFVRLHQANAWKVGSDIDQRPDLVDSRVKPALETAEKLAEQSGNQLAMEMVGRLRAAANLPR